MIHNHFIRFYSPIHAVGFGSGLAYIATTGYWHHTPFVLINPVAYVAFQVSRFYLK